MVRVVPMNLKSKLKLSLVVSVLLTVFSGLAFINNLSVVVRWYAAFNAAGGDSGKMPEAVSGIIPALDWSAVDYSCVSTLVPLLGFVLILRGLILLLRGKRPDPEFFPFFKAYDQLNVAFGLIGTLWGIILIGYYNMETVTMANLMTCLHTALFSTLVAVVWVFVIDHPVIRPFMHRLLEECEPYTSENDDVEDVLERLRKGAAGISEIWAQERENLALLVSSLSSAKNDVSGFSEEVKSIAEGLTKLAESIDAHDKAFADSVKARLDELARSQSERNEELRVAFVSRLEELQKIQCERDEAVKTEFAARLAEMSKAQNERDRLLAEAVAKSLEEMAKSQAVRDKEFDESAKTRLGEIAKSIADKCGEVAVAQQQREERIAEAQLQREKKFDEMLEARVRQLCDESAANALRADKAEAMLARVKSVFGSGL